jgi:hypothetical protein
MTPAERKDANRIASEARSMIEGKPEIAAAMRAEWRKIEDEIESHLAKSKKRWKVYEMAHVSATARLAMLTAFVQGRSTTECVVAALESVGITKAMGADHA